MAALDRGRPGERYLLSGHDLPLSQLAALVAKRTGVPAPKARAPYSVALAAAQVEARISRFSGRRPTAPLTGVKLAGRRVTFSNAKAREELGFDPGSVEDALDAALAWMVDVGHIPESADG